MTPEEQERSERNQRAMAYIDWIREQHEERDEKRKCLLMGCVAVIVFNIIFWTAVYYGLQKLAEL